MGNVKNKLMNELYNDYLNKTLDLIFDIEEEEETNNKNDEIKDEMPSICRNDKGKYYLKNSDGDIISDFYDRILDFHEGIAIVKLGDKYNYIDKWGKPLCDEWFDDAYLFENGLGHVEKDGKENLVDVNGNLVSEEWYDDVVGRYYGFAGVKKDDKWTLIDKTGNPINDDKYDNVEEFYRGYALVEKNYESNFIGIDGNPKFDPWIGSLSHINLGYSIVSTRGKWNIIDDNINLISEEWFDEVKERDNDKEKGHYYHCDVRLRNKVNCYDIKLKRFYCNEWYDSIVCLFEGDDLIVVKDNDKYAFIDKETGDVVDDKWYDEIIHSKGCCIVYDNGKYNIFNEENKPVLDTWYNKIEGINGIELVTRDDGKKAFFDKNGHQINDGWYDEAVENYYWDFGVIGKKRLGIMRWNIIDRNGNELLDNWTTSPINLRYGERDYVSVGYGKKHVEISRYPRNYGKYKVEKKGSNYVLTSPDDTFTIKYKPIRIYGPRYVVCHDKSSIYYYDRWNHDYFTRDYYSEGEIKNYQDDYIIDGVSKLLMYNNRMIDITFYYREHELKYTNYKIRPGIPLLSKDEFLKGNEDMVKARYAEELKKLEECKKQQIEAEEQRKAEDFIKQQQEEKEKLLKTRETSMRHLEEELSRLADCEKRLGIVNSDRFVVSNMLVDYGDHKEINPICFRMGFNRVDFKNMPLKGVRLRGLDLREANISIGENDLQEIENMDLTDTNLEGNYLLPGTKLDGVIIRGARFSIDKDPKTMDINVEAFKKAIYDDKTTINGTPLVELLEKEKQHRR